MPGIDKAAFLKRIASKVPAEPMPGEGSDEEAEPGEEADEGMSCGAQLIQALGLDVDPGPVDAALKEAVQRYAVK